MLKLNKSKINCPKPQKNKNGNYLVRIRKKSACIVSFLEGKDKKLLSLKNCHEIGQIRSKNRIDRTNLRNSLH